MCSRSIKTEYGLFTEHLFYNGKVETIVLSQGILKDCKDVYCRIHSICMSAHFFLSDECDCLYQMIQSQKIINSLSKGIIILLDQEGRGNGHYALMLAAKMSAKYEINQSIAYERNGYSRDSRNYNIAAEIIKFFKIESIVLLSNNIDKYNQLKNQGIKICRMEGLVREVDNNSSLKKYYSDKKQDGHLFIEKLSH